MRSLIGSCGASSWPPKLHIHATTRTIDKVNWGFRTATMSSSAAPSDGAVTPESIKSFQEYLKKSRRVIALLGAGMSASSGLPTFRGAGGLWRTHDAISLATPGAFNENPGLVWQFYNYRRHMALNVSPNPAHYALAALAREMPGFQTLSQNVDGLSVRADHPQEQLQLLHGSLFDLKCFSRNCTYFEPNNFTDPVHPSLAPPASGPIDPTTKSALADISDASVPLPRLKSTDLPQCPLCKNHLLRPGVVWFGENLPSDVLTRVQKYLDAPEPIDLIIVIGTSSRVYPAAGYVSEARDRGARVAVVNMDENDAPSGGWREGDWLFKGDAAVIVPQLLQGVIGNRA